MKTNKSNLRERLDLIAPHLQQHVMDYIDFLVERYSIKTPVENTKVTPKEEASTENSVENNKEEKNNKEEENTKKESSTSQRPPTPIEKPVEVKEEVKTIEKTPDVKNETAIVEEPQIADRTIEITAKEEDATVEEEKPSGEDVQLDEKIARIEEKKKNRLLPDWQELKDAFLDKF